MSVVGTYEDYKNRVLRILLGKKGPNTLKVKKIWQYSTL